MREGFGLKAALRAKDDGEAETTDINKKLKAARELDKQNVLTWLYEMFYDPDKGFSMYTYDELKMLAHDAIVLINRCEINGDRR